MVNVRRLPAIPDYLKPYIAENSCAGFWLHDTYYPYALIRAASFRAMYTSAPFRFALNHHGFVAVSDSIEPQDRPLIAYHESIEYDGLALHQHSCVEALGKELAAAKYFGFGPLSLPGYIERRYRFFRELVDYYENKDRTTEETTILGRLYWSLEYLGAIKKKFSAATPS